MKWIYFTTFSWYPKSSSAFCFLCNWNSALRRRFHHWQNQEAFPWPPLAEPPNEVSLSARTCASQ